MGASDNRKKLHTYIADLDEKKVKAMLTWLEDEVPYLTKKLTEKDKAEIRQRQQNRVSGKSKTYTLQEAKKMFRRKKQYGCHFKSFSRTNRLLIYKMPMNSMKINNQLSVRIF